MLYAEVREGSASCVGCEGGGLHFVAAGGLDGLAEAAAAGAAVCGFPGFWPWVGWGGGVEGGSVRPAFVGDDAGAGARGEDVEGLEVGEAGEDGGEDEDAETRA